MDMIMNLKLLLNHNLTCGLSLGVWCLRELKKMHIWSYYAGRVFLKMVRIPGGLTDCPCFPLYVKKKSKSYITPVLIIIS